MNQNLWGSSMWYSLHTITLVYPLRPSNEDKKNYKNFFMNLQHVIPCSICKNNYKRHILEHPIDNFLENRKTLFNWMVDIHNMVNGETGKKILSYNVVLKKYEDVYKKKIDLLSENDINYDDDKDTWEMRKKKFDSNSKRFNNSNNSCSISSGNDSINNTDDSYGFREGLSRMRDHQSMDITKDSKAIHTINNNDKVNNLNGTQILTDNPENFQNKSIDNSYNFYFLYFLITLAIILLFLNLLYKKIGGINK
jgi:hypothetical protein